MSEPWMATDAVVACAHLAERAGTREFELGYVHDDVPVEEAGWYAHVTYQGARITVQDHRSPSAAAQALAERILSGGMCRCGKTVTLSDERPGCRWQLMGKRWEPGCDAPPVSIPDGKRGDMDALRDAIAERASNPSRWERRGQNKKNRRWRG